MTAREVLQNGLIELNKLEAPSMLLEDYIYLLNKAVQQNINKVYNRFDINQQSTDDLRVLQTTAIITDVIETSTDIVKRSKIKLPDDYLHLLNCIAVFESTSTSSSKCGNDGNSNITTGCRKITADQLPLVIQDYYMQPSYDNPYWSIINRNTTPSLPTNPTMDSQISPPLSEEDFREPKDVLSRSSNQSDVLLEILYGINDNYQLQSVYITYLKSPMYIELTDEQIDMIEDTSQILEFPDYVCYEIINEFVKLVLENYSDARLQTHIPVNQTILTGYSQQQN